MRNLIAIALLCVSPSLMAQTTSNFWEQTQQIRQDYQDTQRANQEREYERQQQRQEERYREQQLENQRQRYEQDTQPRWNDGRYQEYRR